jgi:hypothetical protein
MLNAISVVEPEGVVALDRGRGPGPFGVEIGPLTSSLSPGYRGEGTRWAIAIALAIWQPVVRVALPLPLLHRSLIDELDAGGADV